MEPRPAPADRPVEPDAAPPEATANDASPAEEPGELVARRQFFRAFSRDTARAAIQVAGMAMAFQRGTGAAAGELLGLAVSPGQALDRLSGESAREGDAELGTPAATFRSPYRVEGDEIVLLDQRAYPAQVAEIRCSTPFQLASAMLQRRIIGAPVLGQVAAYGVWCGALAARGQTTFIRLGVVHNAAETLRHARNHVAPVAHATRRVVRVWEAELERTGDDAGAAAAARREADAFAGEVTQAMTDLVAVGLGAIEQPADRPLEVMTLDSTGALAGGLVGGALGVILAIAAAGRPVHVWLLETHPGGAGARLAAWELNAAGVPATVVADGSAAWLLSRTPLDAVLVGADRLAADAAATAVIGTFGLAELAAQHHVPFYVVTPLVTVDPAVPDAAASAVESERYADLGVDLVAQEALSGSILARGPVQDVTPPELIAGLVTEAGLLRPPFGVALAAALAGGGA